MVNNKRVFRSALVIFLFALLWNGVVHLVLLRDADAILDTIGRPSNERSLVLSLVVTALIAILFVWSYARTVKYGTVREGVKHGLFFGILAGVLVDLNQYILYPIPALLALEWFVFGLIEFCLYGVIVGKFYPVDDKK